MAHFLTGAPTAFRTPARVAAGSALRARSALRLALRRLGNDGAVANVRTHLAAAADARAAVDQLAWRVAAADRDATRRRPAPATPHAA
jgi:hypothetical protein